MHPLREIASLANTLSKMAPDNARRLCKATDFVACCRDNLPDELQGAREERRAWETCCNQAADLMNQLVMLVYSHLPDVTLDMVRNNPTWRYDDQATDWQAIVAELRRVEDAALRKLLSAEAISNPAKPGRVKTKRSTERGEGRAKLIAALTKHHEYANGGCLNIEPIGNNELARLAGVDQATASTFFKQQFKGHGKYRAVCADAARLTAAMKLLNGEFAPHLLYGAKPADEQERDED